MTAPLPGTPAPLVWAKNAAGVEVVRVMPDGAVHVNPDATKGELVSVLERRRRAHLRQSEAK